MEESTTYQAILHKGIEKGIEQGIEKGIEQGLSQGRLQEAKGILLLMGEKRFGPPNAQVRAAIDSLADVHKVETLSERLLDVSGWEELLS